MTDQINIHTKALFEGADTLNLEITLEAISNGADINSIDYDDKGDDLTVLSRVLIASKNGYRGRFLDEDDLFPDQAPLIKPDFTEEERMTIAKRLLELGADINKFAEKGGMTSLYVSVYIQSPVIMKFLLDNGADPNINCYEKDHPMYEYVISSVLDHVFDEYSLVNAPCETGVDEAKLKEMEVLLKNAGAIAYKEMKNGE